MHSVAHNALNPAKRDQWQTFPYVSLFSRVSPSGKDPLRSLFDRSMDTIFVNTENCGGMLPVSVPALRRPRKVSLTNDARVDGIVPSQTRSNQPKTRTARPTLRYHVMPRGSSIQSLTQKPHAQSQIQSRTQPESPSDPHAVSKYTPDSWL